MARKFPQGVAQDAITIRGARVSYSSAGHEGAPIILVHGGAADRRDWEQNISVLAASHRVYAPDLAGFGESHRLDISYTLKHFTDFLRDFISALGIGIPFLVGHSLGGRVCLEFARETPNGIAGLVLVAPIGFGGLSITGKFLGTGAWALFKLARKRLPYPDLDVKLSDPNLNGYGGMDVPTLILWGKRDPYFPSKYGRRAQRIMPNSRLKLFNHSGHSPHRREPSAFNSAVLEFFSNSA